MLNIIPLEKKHLVEVASIHSQVFQRQQASTKWITCNFAAFPRILMYVAMNEEQKILGYIQWLQKSGFRKETVLELEQIAVLPLHQGCGVGRTLIQSSLKQVKVFLKEQHATLKAVLVTTRTDNAAQALYKKSLNADAVGVIKNLYSHDEVIMLAKPPI